MLEDAQAHCTRTVLEYFELREETSLGDGCGLDDMLLHFVDEGPEIVFICIVGADDV